MTNQSTGFAQRLSQQTPFQLGRVISKLSGLCTISALIFLRNMQSNAVSGVSKDRVSDKPRALASFGIADGLIGFSSSFFIVSGFLFYLTYGNWVGPRYDHEGYCTPLFIVG